MFDFNYIEGIDALRKEIPDELQYWHKFGNISELHFKHVFDEAYCGYIGCVELLLTDIQNRYVIRLFLFNVSGELRFDLNNGFYCGLTIDDCSELGYEKNCRFRISSFEQDVEFTIYCERMKAELVG